MNTGSAGVPPANNNSHSSISQDSTYKGWHSRGYLPHFDSGEIPQFITFRIADSIPNELFLKWRNMHKHLSKTEAESKIYKLVEKRLDEGTDNAWMKKPEIANIVENAFFHFDGQRYRLHSWVVMPNYIHVLLTPMEGYGIPGILHSLKSFTAKEANRALDRNGEFWQKDYYDRYIRDEGHYYDAIEYIEMNPVKAGLCEHREDWLFSSASAKHKSGRDARAPGEG